MRDRRAVFEGQVAGAAARRDAFGDADLAQRSRPGQRRHRHLRRAVDGNQAKITIQSADARARFPRARRPNSTRPIGATGQHRGEVDACRAHDRRPTRLDAAREAHRDAAPGDPHHGRRRGRRDLQGGRLPDRGRRAASTSRSMPGTHAIGHTRMATEIAVTTHGRASVLDRRRPVPRAQRLAVEPQQSAPRADRATA